MCQARHRPLIVTALIGVVLAVGAGAIEYAAAEGCGYRPELKRVQFASDTGRHCFDVGFVLLTLGCPAWLLVIVGRTRNGPTAGPLGTPRPATRLRTPKSDGASRVSRLVSSGRLAF